MKKMLAAFVALLLATSACSAVGSPSSRPDHGPPAQPNGNIINPQRPAGIPAEAAYVSLHVLVMNDDWEQVENVAVKVGINAASEVPGQNVHGVYPFEVYTYTPYTHTIWFPPGLSIVADLTATIDPPNPHFSVVCDVSSWRHPQEQFLEIPPTHDVGHCHIQWVADIDGV